MFLFLCTLHTGKVTFPSKGPGRIRTQRGGGPPRLPFVTRVCLWLAARVGLSRGSCSILAFEPHGICNILALGICKWLVVCKYKYVAFVGFRFGLLHVVMLVLLFVSVLKAKKQGNRKTEKQRKAMGKKTTKQGK